jgi:hypothetical protein
MGTNRQKLRPAGVEAATPGQTDLVPNLLITLTAGAARRNGLAKSSQKIIFWVPSGGSVKLWVLVRGRVQVWPGGFRGAGPGVAQ